MSMVSWTPLLLPLCLIVVLLVYCYFIFFSFFVLFSSFVPRRKPFWLFLGNNGPLLLLDDTFFCSVILRYCDLYLNFFFLVFQTAVFCWNVTMTTATTKTNCNVHVMVLYIINKTFLFLLIKTGDILSRKWGIFLHNLKHRYGIPYLSRRNSQASHKKKTNHFL